MEITINGTRCITCRHYSQYYELGDYTKFYPCDAGYCNRKHKTIQPGGGCDRYEERSNVKTGAEIKANRNGIKT